MKTQERTIYIAYALIYFIIGIIFLSAAIISTETLFKASLMIGILLTPFIIVFDIAVIMIFIKAIYTTLKVILSYKESKPLFYIQEKIFKLNNFIKNLPNLLNKILIIAFFIYWFLFIITTTILWIKEKHYSSLLFLIPFIGAGILVIKTKFSQK